MAIDLKGVIPWGRSLEEYQRIFGLQPRDLAKSTLGCGDGPAAFNAGWTALGGKHISLDPLYAFSAEQIAQRVEDSHQQVKKGLEENRASYHWGYFSDPESLCQARLKAAQDFLADYQTGQAQGRYLEGSLPKLSFADQQFDLVLCSHLLFLYDQALDLKFHRQSLAEMCRVGKEVRVFPLVNLKDQPSPWLEPCRASLRQLGFRTKLVPVDYRLQKGADHALWISA